MTSAVTLPMNAIKAYLSLSRPLDLNLFHTYTHSQRDV